MLDLIDLSKKLPKKEYRARLPRLRRRLLQLQQAAWQAKVPSILLFEGWDGSGKGDCVRKVTERLEPRGYKVYYVTHEPRSYVRSLPWMWRFFLEIPSYGQMALFHRSWYRRALTDRGEGRLDDLGWTRTIRDILDFERTLTDDGYVMVKFFLHISKEEREARYRALEEDPAESYRIDRRAWKIHRRYDDSLLLVEEILARTETAACPWKIIEATDPRWAVIQVLESTVLRLEEAFKDRGLPLPEATESEDDDMDEDA